MDKVLSLISSVEAAIRYLLSGAVIAVLALLSVDDPGTFVAWGVANQAIAALCVLFGGFTAFSIYRLILWTIGDCIAWQFGLSAPTLYPSAGDRYARPYSRFLRWRHSDDLPQSLSGYLNFRWSVAHFVNVSALAGFVAAYFAQSQSIIGSKEIATVVISLLIFAFGVFQVAFLYRVERELCRDRKSK